MFEGVSVALGSPSSAVHPTNLTTPNGWSLAPKPAPVRFGVAPQRLVHIQLCGVDEAGLPSFAQT